MVVPGWLVWLQLGLSTTLAVLFVAMLIKTRQQSESIRQLQERVAGIENSRALDRTTAIEDQLRSTAARLQNLERKGLQLSALVAENSRLRQQLQGTDEDSGKPSPPSPVDDVIAPLPPVRP